jgi:hypothetical protein
MTRAVANTAIALAAMIQMLDMFRYVAPCNNSSAADESGTRALSKGAAGIERECSILLR